MGSELYKSRAESKMLSAFAVGRRKDDCDVLTVISIIFAFIEFLRCSDDKDDKKD